MSTTTIGNVQVTRVAYTQMTNHEAGEAGFCYNPFLKVWQHVTITGPATVQDLLAAGVVYTSFHQGVCRIWLSAFIPDEQTRSNVDYLIMQPAGFTPSVDLLAGLDPTYLEYATICAMGGSGRGWIKEMMTRLDYDHLQSPKCLDCREFIPFQSGVYFCGPCKEDQVQAVFGDANPADPWHTQLWVAARALGRPLARLAPGSAPPSPPGSPPPELWLPGTFHELPDVLVEKYMDEYRANLRFRMCMREMLQKWLDKTWLRKVIGMRHLRLCSIEDIIITKKAYLVHKDSKKRRAFILRQYPVSRFEFARKWVKWLPL